MIRSYEAFSHPIFIKNGTLTSSIREDYAKQTRKHLLVSLYFIDLLLIIHIAVPKHTRF